MFFYSYHSTLINDYNFGGLNYKGKFICHRVLM